MRPLDSLIVSVEWDEVAGSFGGWAGELGASGCSRTAGGSTYLEDLKAGLNQMAGYVFAFTHGQIHIRTITIYTGGQMWEEADIRILASRSQPPSAFVGGNAVVRETFSAGANRPFVVFAPGPIQLGRLWNGRGARCGAWSDPAGWRTIAHEWAHYALRLYDEYIGQSVPNQQFCDAAHLRPDNTLPALSTVSNMLQSLMSSHYLADQLSFWPAGQQPESCKGTPHDLVYGEPTWATVQRFFPTLSRKEAPPYEQEPTRLAVAPARSGDASVQLRTRRTEAPLYTPDPPDITVVAPVGSVNRSVWVRTLLKTRGTVLGESYLIRRDAGNNPLRIISQGETIVDEALPTRFWGISPDSYPAIFAQSLVLGKPFVFPQDYRAPGAALEADKSFIMVSASSWEPEIAVTPVLNWPLNQKAASVVDLRVTVTDAKAREPHTFQVAYCSSGSEGCQPLQHTSSEQVQGTFRMQLQLGLSKAPDSYGYVYLRNVDLGIERVLWYQQAGGVGPAHSGGLAPLVDGRLALDLVKVQAPESSSKRTLDHPMQLLTLPLQDFTVLYHPAMVYSLPPRGRRLVGLPLQVHVGQGSLNTVLRARFTYDEDQLNRLVAILDEPIGEGRRRVTNLGSLHLLQFHPTTRTWSTPLLTGSSQHLNWLSASIRFESGSAIIALAVIHGPQANPATRVVNNPDGIRVVLVEAQ